MSDDKVRDEAREAAWADLCRKGDPCYRPSLFADGFNAGWEAATAPARDEALEEAANLVRTWSIRKGGFSELEYQIRAMKGGA